MEIPLPPVEEQQCIVARVEELATRIEEARGLKQKVHEDCDVLCRSILSDTSDGAPVLTPMRELVKLRELDITVSPEEVYWFAGVYSFGKGLFRGQRKRGMEFSYNRLTRLKAGNFVYPKLMAWEGAFALVPSEGDGLVVSPEFPVFEIDQQRLLPETLEVYFHIPSVWLAVSGASTGTNVRRRRLNPADFLAFEIPLPPMKTQKRLREVKTKLDQINQLQSKTSAELNALLPSILDKAFKGEL
jgi:type I restriction enzyme S subunit